MASLENFTKLGHKSCSEAMTARGENRGPKHGRVKETAELYGCAAGLAC